MPLPGPNNTVVERVWFSAGQHLLEGELAYGEGMPAPRGAAVLACSHPLLGGSMHNNVIRGLGDGLAERGLVTLRFNYRGVGGSQGPTIDVARHVAEFWKTSHVPGELSLWQDVQAAIGFLRRSTAAVLPLTLIGYSFGSALLPYLGPAAAYVLIAPPPEPARLRGAPGSARAHPRDRFRERFYPQRRPLAELVRPAACAQAVGADAGRQPFLPGAGAVARGDRVCFPSGPGRSDSR